MPALQDMAQFYYANSINAIKYLLGNEKNGKINR